MCYVAFHTGLRSLELLLKPHLLTERDLHAVASRAVGLDKLDLPITKEIKGY